MCRVLTSGNLVLLYRVVRRPPPPLMEKRPPPSLTLAGAAACLESSVNLRNSCWSFLMMASSFYSLVVILVILSFNRSMVWSLRLIFSSRSWMSHLVISTSLRVVKYMAESCSNLFSRRAIIPRRLLSFLFSKMAWRSSNSCYSVLNCSVFFFIFLFMDSMLSLFPWLMQSSSSECFLLILSIISVRLFAAYWPSEDALLIKLLAYCVDYSNCTFNSAICFYKSSCYAFLALVWSITGFKSLGVRKNTPVWSCMRVNSRLIASLSFWLYAFYSLSRIVIISFSWSSSFYVCLACRWRRRISC